MSHLGAAALPLHSTRPPPPSSTIFIHFNRYQEETKKAVESINAVMSHLGTAALELLTDRDKLLMLVAGGSALAVGVYGARCV